MSLYGHRPVTTIGASDEERCALFVLGMRERQQRRPMRLMPALVIVLVGFAVGAWCIP